MKKLFVSILTVLLLVSLVACGSGISTNENDAESPKETNNSTEKNEETGSANSNTEIPTDLNNWGVEEIITTDNGENLDRYTIRIPQYKGVYHMYSKISEQFDKTIVLLSGQSADTPKVENVADIFLTYIDYTIESLKAFYGIRSTNYKISVDDSNEVKIGEYTMYAHEGTITYDYDGVRRSQKYVAYATILKPSGNCAYWMVYDVSDDASNGNLIAEHALNMAKTFRDEQ